MNYYHLDNPDSYYECFDKEVKHFAKLMSTLDNALIHSNLPPVGKTKDLFDMVETMLYSVEKRYKKDNAIVEEESDYFTYLKGDEILKKNDLVESMKTVLQEEVTRYFDQLSGAAK
jgi:hypothetical protein